MRLPLHFSILGIGLAIADAQPAMARDPDPQSESVLRGTS